jgi:hypothetical protein
MEKCENQDRKQVEKCEKDSYLYGTLLWVVDMERDSYSLFFLSGGGGVGKFGFQNRLGNHGDIYRKSNP